MTYLRTQVRWEEFRRSGQKHWLWKQTGEDSDSDSVTCYLPSDFRQVAYFIISGRLTDKLSIMISAWLGCEHRAVVSSEYPAPCWTHENSWLCTQHAVTAFPHRKPSLQVCPPSSHPVEAGMAIAPAWAKERSRKRVPCVISVGSMRTRPVALLCQRLDFGA